MASSSRATRRAGISARSAPCRRIRDELGGGGLDLARGALERRVPPGRGARHQRRDARLGAPRARGARAGTLSAGRAYALCWASLPTHVNLMCMPLDRRTQILLDAARHRLLEERARRDGVSVAAVIRAAIDRELGHDPEGPARAVRDLLAMAPVAVGDPAAARGRGRGDVRARVTRAFLDSNVFLYATGAQHELREPCRLLLEAVGEGQLEAETSVEVLQEVAHVRGPARRHARRRPCPRSACRPNLQRPCRRARGSRACPRPVRR